jgi:hypothetical protein
MIMSFFTVLLLINGFVFSADENAESSSPKNTISIDAGLTGTTLFSWGITGDAMFGTAIQYERQISDNGSAAGRLEYQGVEFDSANMSSFSVEAHARLYLLSKLFFLDGMLGYAMFNNDDEITNFTAHFIKYGGTLGLNIDFGKPGGLVFEPAIGYYWSFGNRIFDAEPDQIDNYYDQLTNIMYRDVIKNFFVGGLQISLGIGFRF